MAELSNLDTLWLSWSLYVDIRVSQGIGTTLRERFDGKLRLCNRYAAAGECVANMLLGVPTGRYLTKPQIECLCKLLPSDMRLLEACGNTLVMLSCVVGFRRKFYSGQAGSSARNADTDSTS